jgi:hypothetical protein
LSSWTNKKTGKAQFFPRGLRPPVKAIAVCPNVLHPCMITNYRRNQKSARKFSHFARLFFALFGPETGI